MPGESKRSRSARAAAEEALVRIVHHYGTRPEFVVLGELVPYLLCSESEFRHAGTTDIDVQVDLEIACGSVNTRRLETALKNAEFEPDSERVWRWSTRMGSCRTAVKFELLADLDDEPAEATVCFEDCEKLGAANLRGSGFASRDVEVRVLAARTGGVDHVVEVNVTGLAGFLLAKCSAARARRLTKEACAETAMGRGARRQDHRAPHQHGHLSQPPPLRLHRGATRFLELTKPTTG